MKRFFPLVLVAAIGCGNPSAESTSGSAEPSTTPAATSSADPKAAVVMDYLRLKDALVAGKNEEAAQEAAAMQASLAKAPAYAALTPALEELVAAADLAGKRKAFEPLSDQLYPLLRTAKPEGMRLFRQYCPMAFDFKGAFWISDAREIMNPYFGDEMLHCGEVREIL